VFETVFQIHFPLTTSKMDIRKDKGLRAITLSGENCAWLKKNLEILDSYRSKYKVELMCVLERKLIE
jgi:hypothetical protein